MKKIILLIGFIIGTYTLKAQTENGTIHDVPLWKWVESQNGDYSVCGITKGGRVLVIGQYDNKTVLCKYISYSTVESTQCKDGTLFLLDKKELAKFQFWVEKYSSYDFKNRVRIDELINDYNSKE